MKVLITAGQVFGKIDDNKIIGNQVRGIWAMKFARWLADRGHHVTLLVPTTTTRPMVAHGVGEPRAGATGTITVTKQGGFDDYRLKCREMAMTHDAAVLAAAVVNWIPAEPVKGKMSTAGYVEGDRINIPFYLAPKVINDMRVLNPKLTLIGCKLLSNAHPEDLIDSAYYVVLNAKCNVVVANDMGRGLRTKRLVYQDRTIVDYDDDFDGLYAALLAVIEDKHYQTSRGLAVFHDDPLEGAMSRRMFDAVIDKYRARFIPQLYSLVFGSVAVRVSDQLDPTSYEEYLVSPREKGDMFTAADAVTVTSVKDRRVFAVGGKATLNAPLLARMLQKYPDAPAVLHLHEQLEGVPTVPHAPPGTARDNEREIPGPAFNIEGHGFIAVLDANLELPDF